MRYLFLAVSFLSIIPFPKRLISYDERFYKVVGYFPLAGLVIAGLSYLFFAGLRILLPEELAFLLSIFFYHILNGGLHLDGFVDFSDAIFGAKKDSSRFKEILKDSRIGTMGAFALILYFSVIFMAADYLKPDFSMFLFLGMAGRLTIVNCIHRSGSLFDEGLGKYFIEKATMNEFLLGNISFFLISAILGINYLVPAFLVWIFSFIYRNFVLINYGGFSGDLFGAGCIITELMVIIYYVKVI